MEILIANVIDKITKMYKCNKKYKEILDSLPQIDVKIDKRHKLKLSSVIFSAKDRIIAYDHCILFCPRYGKQKELLTYNGWDELLKTEPQS